MERFRGVYTAIVTPFCDTYRYEGVLRTPLVDEGVLRILVERNIKRGFSGIVACGTTGETPTLTSNERKRVIELTVECVNKRVPVIAGTGSNSTEQTIFNTQDAKDLGASVALVVTPYYNKPTQEGLYQHFKAVADSVDIPMILYNVPSRTGGNLKPSTLEGLANKCPNIVGIKEASGDFDQVEQIISLRESGAIPQGFSVLSGDDPMTLDLIKAGGDGVISVASNLVPEQMSKMVELALQGDYQGANVINEYLTPLFKAEFIETNPVPIKYMLALKGHCRELYRLPLVPASEENKEVIRDTLRIMNL
ncbi:4-hydroxy-tetrahydrodipicolinate synthase [Nanoarchaeota archaeon]